MIRSEGDTSLKNPVTPPGIDPGTVRLVAQRLNLYATPGPIYIYIHLFIRIIYIKIRAEGTSQLQDWDMELKDLESRRQIGEFEKGNAEG
jgi:hypothetical protein